MSYTADQVKEAIDIYEESEDYDVDYSNLYDCLHDGVWGDQKNEYQIPDLGLVEYVDSYGGEGQGDDYWVVFKTVETNQYWRVDGWYASHYGGELDGEVYEVEPKEVVQTVYERKTE